MKPSKGSLVRMCRCPWGTPVPSSSGFGMRGGNDSSPKAVLYQ